jgi:hypothetical protein
MNSSRPIVSNDSKIGVVKQKLLFLFTLLLFAPVISAAADQSVGQSLQIAPLKYEEKLNLGEVKEGTIDIANPTQKDEIISIETASLKMASSGELAFYKNTVQYNFEKFITFTDKEFVLPANTGRKVKFRLGIPIAAPAGGYFGGVFFRILPGGNNSDQSKAITSGQIGTLFLLTVGQGDVRQGELKKFIADNNPFADKTDFEIEHANLAKYDTNPRGSYLKPVGILSIKNIFGKEMAMQKIENIYVLPQTSRIIKTEIKTPFLIGFYKAELKISNYPGDPVYTKSVRFVKISPLFVLLVAILAGFSYVILRFYKNGLLKLKLPAGLKAKKTLQKTKK